MRPMNLGKGEEKTTIEKELELNNGSNYIISRENNFVLIYTGGLLLLKKISPSHHKKQNV